MALFEPQTKEAAEWWLSFSEFGLLPFALLIVIGLIGELREGKRKSAWIPSSIGPKRWDWPKIWEWIVIAAVLGELFCDGGIWEYSDALQAFQDQETPA